MKSYSTMADGLGVFLISASTLGCASSASLQGVVSEGVPQAPALKVYALVDHHDADLACVDYGKTLWQELHRALADEHVESEGQAVDLKLDAYRSDVSAYRPDLVLRVRATGGVPFYYVLFSKCGGKLAGYQSVSYDVDVLAPDLETSVWHSTVSNNGSVHAMDSRLEQMATLIVRRLKTEGVFNGRGAV